MEVSMLQLARWKQSVRLISGLLKRKMKFLRYKREYTHENNVWTISIFSKKGKEDRNENHKRRGFVN